jgi:hypothetical protein
VNREPWKIMLKRGVFSHLPVRYRVFLIACKLGLGVEMLKVWGSVKNDKKK